MKLLVSSLAALLTLSVVGVAAADRVKGTPGNDIIAGLAGNDIIDGRGGFDTSCGDRGRDTLRDTGLISDYGHTNTVLYGGPGHDRIVINAGFGRGGPGNDRIVTFAGASAMLGARGNDSITDFACNFGAAINGDDGDDRIRTNKARDGVRCSTLAGSIGKDLNGGPGFDRGWASTADNPIGFERLTQN